MTRRSEPSSRLLWLLQVTSPIFPTGAFAHSLGFETLVVEDGLADADALGETAGLWLRHALAPVDGAAVALAREAARRRDVDGLAALDETLGALKLPRESLEASLKTGTAFVRAADHAFGGRRLRRYRAAVEAGVCAGHGATGFGVAAADARLPAGEAVLAFLHAAYANLVGVVARLVPLGQLDVQRLLAGARGTLVDAAVRACSTPLDRLGSTAAFLDVASMRHERLYTRLCIS